jgi:hypothetical protein
LQKKKEEKTKTKQNKMENITVVEKDRGLKRTSTVSIKPFANNANSNMGLERYEMVVFEGVIHEEVIACLEFNGIKRYVTGLNEFAPEIKALPEDEREAATKEIRTIVAQLEKELASNIIDPKDEQFWNKVKLLRPDNSEFWEKIVIRVGNDPLFLDPAIDPYDLIKLRAIEAGGFSIVAKSLDQARTNSSFKFYLDKYEETASIKTEVKKLRNKALAELQKLYDKNTNKLFLVCKVIDANSTQYRKATPNDILYDNMDKYINGETVDKDKKKTASRFLEISGFDMETLKLRAMVKDANFYKIIATRGDGNIYHMASGAMLGKTPAEVSEYLKNPLNEEILMDLTRTVEKHWNN